MFWNKEKAIWKKAFQNKNDPNLKLLFDMNKKMQEAKSLVEHFKSDKFIRDRAYELAEQNGFAGSPEFYWDNVVQTNKIRFLVMKHHMWNLEDVIIAKKSYYKFRNGK